MYLPKDNKEYWYCDIEADSLVPTQVWCVCAESTTQKVTLTTYDSIRSFFASEIAKGCVFAFHNGLSYDVPVLNRLCGTKIALSDTVDTMVLSMLFLPSLEGGHGLKAWGDRLKEAKGEFNDFSHLSDEMITYCRQDAHICRLTHEALIKRMTTAGFSDENCHLETLAWYLVGQQKKNGFHFNIDGANALLLELRTLENDIRDRVHEIWPPTFESVGVYKSPYRNDGQPSANYQRHLERYNVRLSEDRQTFESFELVPFNIGSPNQRTQRLLQLGWVPGPDERTPTGLPKPTSKGQLVPSLLRFVHESGDEGPKLIAQWMEINARANMIRTWIDAYNPDTGCIHGSLWLANTLRYRHSDPNTANIPAVRVGVDGPLLGMAGVYTYEARDLWGTRDPRTRRMVGVDAKGIQLRVLAHHLRNPEFAKEVLSGDPHSYNQKIGGIRTRSLAKTFIYAFLLGAGDAKVGQIIGGSTKDGRDLKSRFTNNFPGLGRLLDHLKRQVERNGRILLCDGTPLRVEQLHTRLGYLLQGDENRIMKAAAIFIWRECRRLGIDALLVGNIHDEFQYDVLEKDVEAFVNICTESFKKAGESFNYTVPIECDYKIGLTWSETH